MTRLARSGVKPLGEDLLGKTVMDGQDRAALPASRTSAGLANPFRAPQQKPEPEDWRDQALCREVDTELFFSEKGQADLTRIAKKVCSNCPVIAECLEYVLTHEMRFGVWGGTTDNQRRRMGYRKPERSLPVVKVPVPTSEKMLAARRRNVAIAHAAWLAKKKAEKAS